MQLSFGVYSDSEELRRHSDLFFFNSESHFEFAQSEKYLIQLIHPEEAEQGKFPSVQKLKT